MNFYTSDGRGSGASSTAGFQLSGFGASAQNSGNSTGATAGAYTTQGFQQGVQFSGSTAPPSSSGRGAAAGGGHVQVNDSRLTNIIESYFEPQQSSWSHGGQSQGANAASAATGAAGGLANISQYRKLQSTVNYAGSPATASIGAISGGVDIHLLSKTKAMSDDKKEKDRAKRVKQAEAARLRYHRLSTDEKKALNLKRTMAQKRKRQRVKELEELDAILRASNDIQEDPEITEQLRGRRMRAKWAEAARTRYQRMTEEERREHNNRRRIRQLHAAMRAATQSQKYHQAAALERENAAAAAAATVAGGGGGGSASQNLTPTQMQMKDDEALQRHIKEANAKKAEAARLRYHRMTEEEKRLYNQRRTEAFRRRRMEEEMLLAMPIGRINGEALDRAQQIVVRNAKRAEAARLRYQRMTPEQRKLYNQKRYTPKRKRATQSNGAMDGLMSVGNGQSGIQGSMRLGGSSAGSSAQSHINQRHRKEVPIVDEFDALSSLERDVLKRTQIAHAAIARQQRGASAQPATFMLSSTPGPSSAAAAAAATATGQTVAQQHNQQTTTPGQYGLQTQSSQAGPSGAMLNPYAGRGG